MRNHRNQLGEHRMMRVNYSLVFCDVRPDVVIELAGSIGRPQLDGLRRRVMIDKAIELG
jgi:hypothetical protein